MIDPLVQIARCRKEVRCQNVVDPPGQFGRREKEVEWQSTVDTSVRLDRGREELGCQSVLDPAVRIGYRGEMERQSLMNPPVQLKGAREQRQHHRYNA